jgi:hypothetical protein
MFPLIRAIFQDERIKNADVFALFRLRSVDLNRVPLEQAVLCSDGLLLLRRKPKAPIIMLSAALDVPEQAMKLVDAFVAKDRLASQLLPAIAQLHRRDRPLSLPMTHQSEAITKAPSF